MVGREMKEGKIGRRAGKEDREEKSEGTYIRRCEIEKV